MGFDTPYRKTCGAHRSTAAAALLVVPAFDLIDIVIFSSNFSCSRRIRAIPLMKKLLAPILLAMCCSFAVAQDAPQLPKQLTCEELSPKLVDRSYDAFLMYEVTRNRLQMRITIEDGKMARGSMEYRPDRVNLEIQRGKITRAYCG